MPYIEPMRRDTLDMILEKWGGFLTPNGSLNYFLFALCKRTIKPSYSNYKNYIGELRQCATEIERRLLAPYEDEAMKRNGDVE
jgi:hypothetical protein